MGSNNRPYGSDPSLGSSIFLPELLSAEITNQHCPQYHQGKAKTTNIQKFQNILLTVELCDQDNGPAQNQAASTDLLQELAGRDITIKRY